MFNYKRSKINFNKEKIKEKYLNEIRNFFRREDDKETDEELLELVMGCINRKWDINRTDYEQGFDSDCTHHCSTCDLCFKIFRDKECEGEGHLEPIIVSFGERVWGPEKTVEETMKEYEQYRKDNDFQF